MTISPPIKILALVGVIAVVALGASTMLLGKSSSSNVRTSTAQPHTAAAPVVHRTPVHVKPTLHVAAKKHAAVATKHAAKTKHVTHAKPKLKPAPRGNLVYEDLPAPLQWQLALHRVVVVSLYNPNADVDAISVAEAHAGALDMGAGFLLVNVLDNKVAGILTALLPGGGLLPDPGVLVYRAPGDILVRLDGFADRTSVAQAVTNALAGQTSGIPSVAATASAGTPVQAPGTTGAP